MDKLKKIQPTWVLAITIGLALIGKSTFFFFRYPTFFLFWDYLGHVQKAMKISWPWAGGWDNAYWGGYPTLLYPPLSHWVLKGFLAITQSTQIALAILIIISLLLLLHALWIFTKNKLNNQYHQLVAFSLSILCYLLSPVNALVSLKGILFSGTITASFAIPFLLYFLSSKKWYQQGFWVGFLLLTHSLTAGIVILYMLIELTAKLFSSSKNKFIEIKFWFYSMLLAGFIGLPWLLPFLDHKFQHTAFSIAGRIFPLGILYLILLVISLFIQLLARKKPSKLFIFTLLLGLLSIMPLWPTKILERYFLRGIHFYRYYSFLIILAPTAILANKNKFSQKIFSKINQPIASFIAIITILTAIFIKFSSLNYEVKTSWNKLPTDITGKFIDTASSKDVDLFPRAADHLLTQNTNLLGSFGLFFESSHTGLIYAAAKHLLNEDSYSVPVYKIYIEEMAIKINDVDNLLNLLGINYQAFTSEEASVEGTIAFAKINIKRENKNLNHQRYYHLKKINDTKLIEALSENIKINPKLNLWDWWSDPEKRLTTRKKHQPPIALDLSKPEISRIKISADKIKFSIDSLDPTPVYLKFSYSPYWQATALDNLSSTTQPIWVTPGNMVIYAAGDIELSWQTPIYLKVFAPISMIIFTTTALMLISEKLKNKTFD